MKTSLSSERAHSTTPRLAKGVSNSTRLLYIFLALIILSTCAKIVTFIGDERIEEKAAAVTDFNAQWIAWRTIEDSIRTSLEQIEIQSLDEVAPDGNPGNQTALFASGREDATMHPRTSSIFGPTDCGK